MLFAFWSPHCAILPLFLLPELPIAMHPIEMVDLKRQHLAIRKELNAAYEEVMNTAGFINGPSVQKFATELEQYIGAHVVPCANGTDALQICLMALKLKPGAKVLVPAFTYVATAEVAALLGYELIFADVDPEDFNLTPDEVAKAFEQHPDIQVVVPVHLFGQMAPMEPILKLAKAHGAYVVEDMAQAIGAHYSQNGLQGMAGTLGHMSATSFFPSKNLGCMGDGGAIISPDKGRAAFAKTIANHGQGEQYVHEEVGVNSRLDGLQAAFLSVKLKQLDKYIARRQEAAGFYDECLGQIDGLRTPVRRPYSTHVYHQYTLKWERGNRDALLNHLAEKGIPAKIYYPIPLYKQKAYQACTFAPQALSVTEILSEQVLSLPMHTELDQEQLHYICDTLIGWCKIH